MYSCKAFLLYVFSCVTSNVAAEKKCFTFCTAVRLLSCMSSHVTCQMWQLRKGLFTFCTAVRLFSCMHSHVLCQMCLPRKGFFILSTAIRLFSCMHSHVWCQMFFHILYSCKASLLYVFSCAVEVF